MTVPVSSDSQTIGTLLVWARRALELGEVSNPGQEALWLLEHALNLRSHQVIGEADRLLPPDVWVHAHTLVSKRTAREPLQYLLGTQEFCGLEFDVNPAVLIPRPETEILVQEVVRRAGLHRGSTVVDVGTGSGCIAVTLATVLSAPHIIAIDRSPEALATAKRNASKHAVRDKIEWLEGDLLAPLREKGLAGAIDVIVSNPPYIAEVEWAQLQPEVRFEPRLALIGGPKGTEFHERLLEDSHEFLAPDGLLVMEVGQGQGPTVQEIAQRVGGYAAVRVVADAAGIERVVIAQRIG